MIDCFLIPLVIIIIVIAWFANYKGNDSNTYNSKLQSPEWKEKRNYILKRDGYKCTMCGSTHNLQVHHKYYIKHQGKYIEPWDYSDDALITLCARCHYRVHKNKPNKVYFFK